MISSTLQKYRCVQELGSGAMGAVYEAIDILTERPVALKVLRAELAKQPELIDRFHSEAVTLARLNHPNIALLYDFFRDGEDYYMAIEFVRGQSLESLISSDGCLDTQLAARIMSQTLDALAHAHSMGVLHRDIKPANILVTGDGRVKVTDFGIARVLGSTRMTRHGRIIGTLEYMAPERIRGDECDSRSDLYSAGAVLYEMLAGKLPFAAQTDFELIKAQLEQEPAAIAEVRGAASAREWDAVVHRALAKSASERFQTAEEFRAALPKPALATPVGVGGPTALKPTRLSQTGHLALEPLPEPLKAGPEPASVPALASELFEVWPKNSAGAVILAASAVLAVVLALGIALLFRSGIVSKKEITPATTPASVATAPAPPPPDADAPQADDSWTDNQPAITLPGQSSTTIPRKRDATVRKSPKDERREAALRALRREQPEARGSKRSAALRALEE